jgi:exodeoxyribonuclease VII large subunit
MAQASSPEQPIPVRQVSRMLGDWVHRLGFVWVEGEIAQLNRRPGSSLAFLTLRDPDAAASMSVTCSPKVLDALEVPVREGARVVVHARPTWYAGRGTVSLNATEIRPIGLGELLARIEVLKQILAAEGLFAPERKQPLPFLPRSIGLISGRGSAAERDVLENTRRRWPGAHFRVESTAVQGAAAVPGIVTALRTLQADPEVDVIVIARGGGSVEDLLPFSDEVLLRAVSACSTPVVSAIGHEQDSPLLDLVADVRASTPTDAARRVVPDLQTELAGLRQATARMRTSLTARLDREQHRLEVLRGHRVLRSADDVLGTLRERINDLTARTTRTIDACLERSSTASKHLRQQLFLLSPASTLARGYAVVRAADGSVVHDPASVAPGEPLTVRVDAGTFDVRRSDDPSTPKVER